MSGTNLAVVQNDVADFGVGSLDGVFDQQSTPAAPQIVTPSSPPAAAPAGQQPSPEAPAARANGQQGQPSGDGEQAMVPSSRLREASERARAAETRAQALELKLAEFGGYLEALSRQQQAAPQPQGVPQEQAPPIPDLIDQPAEFAGWVVSMADRRAREIVATEFGPLLQQFRDLRLFASDRAAEAKYGREAIRAATAAAVNAGLKDHFMALADPVGEAVSWYQGAQVVSTYGSDPVTVKQKVASELLADPAFRQQILAAAGIQVPQQPAPQAPPQARAPNGFAPASAPQPVAPPPLGGAPSAAGAAAPMGMGSPQSSLDAMFAERNKVWFGG